MTSAAKTLVYSISTALLLLNFALSITAQTVITLSFDNPSMTPTSCNTIFTEEGIPQQLVDINPGSCSFNYNATTGNLDLFPAKLSVDLSGLGPIEGVEVDIADLCGPGCTGIELLDNGNVILSADATGNGPTTLILDNSNLTPVDELTLFSFEDRFYEIRITVIDSDPCEGTGDTDNDSICDALDVCPGFDDTIDRDGNGIPDYCDFCDFNRTFVEASEPGDNLIYASLNNNTSGQLIKAGADITFNAGFEIDLIAGFEVELNAIFHGLIEGCILPTREKG